MQNIERSKLKVLHKCVWGRGEVRGLWNGITMMSDEVTDDVLIVLRGEEDEGEAPKATKGEILGKCLKN